MVIFFKSFPNKKIELDICWEMLKDIPEDQFRTSIKKIIAAKDEIYQSTNIVALIRKNAIIKNVLLAGEAWAEVLRTVSSIGSYGNPIFKEEIIFKAVECVGWRNICLSENIGVERAHFMKVYESLASKAKEDIVYSEGLTGKNERITDDRTNLIGVK